MHSYTTPLSYLSSLSLFDLTTRERTMPPSCLRFPEFVVAYFRWSDLFTSHKPTLAIPFLYALTTDVGAMLTWKWHLGLREGFHFEGGIAARSSKHHENTTTNIQHQHEHRLTYTYFPSRRCGTAKYVVLHCCRTPYNYLPYLTTLLLAKAMQGVRLKFHLFCFPTRSL